MFELGKKNEIFGAELLEPIQTYGALKGWPSLKAGFSLVCGYDQGVGERMIVCDDMNDVRQLNEGYRNGFALRLKWYQAPDPGFITFIPGEPAAPAPGQ